MSHFSVLVIGNDVAGQLAPYDENLEVERYVEVKEPGNHWFAADARKSLGLDEDAPVTAEQVVAYHNGQYANEASLFVHEGQVGKWSTRNPKSKWDYWREGGRWHGFWLLNAEGAETLALAAHVEAARYEALKATAEYSEFAAILSRLGGKDWDPPNSKRGVRANSAIKRHVDLAGMRAEAEDDARKQWTVYVAAVCDAVREHGMGEPWSQIYERAMGSPIDAPDLPNHDAINRARHEWRVQPYIRALCSHHDLWWINDPHGYFGPDLDEHSCDAFVKRAGDCAFAPYAVVKDGEWAAKGRMGWFGMSDEQVSQTGWNDRVAALIESLKPNARLTIVDCHI